MLDFKKTFIGIFGFFAVCIGVLILAYLSIYFWPFLVAMVISIILERLITVLLKKIKISRKILGTILVVITYIIIATIIGLVIAGLIGEMINLSTKIPEIYNRIKQEYKESYAKIQIFIDRTPNKISNEIYDFGLEILSKLKDIATDVINFVISFVMFMPKLIIYIIVTFLATLFLVTDRREISKGLYKIFPTSMVIKIERVCKNSIKSLTNLLKAQGIIILVTFIELTITFVILKRDYPITLALLVALVDALPILGVGIILIPWAIYSAVTGNITLGIALIIAYIIITVVRQLIEPKVVSKNIGIHPFITLLSMYIGFKLVGVLGMVLGPVMMIIYKNVFEIMFEAGFFKKMFIYKERK